MKIERLIDGCKIEIELTSEELNKAYAEEKRKLDIQEVRDVLTELNPGDTLKMCSFPYPSHRYLRDDKIEEAEQNIMDNEELMLQISDQFQEIQVMCNSSYNKSMEVACKLVLKQFGEKYPYFLKGYETIEVIAYQRYQQDWIRNRHYSEAFLQRIHKEHEEYFQVNRCISFAEYIDEFGFEGECYACIDEFLESEYLDETYMKSLLDEKEYLEYLKDIYPERTIVRVVMERRQTVEKKFAATKEELEWLKNGENPFYDKMKEELAASKQEEYDYAVFGENEELIIPWD